ncbi:MAG: hypothetical protein GX489_09350 [Firmicutes bacterium]|nr:hypothetical protein [Bacillota bacterium]
MARLGPLYILEFYEIKVMKVLVLLDGKEIGSIESQQNYIVDLKKHISKASTQGRVLQTVTINGLSIDNWEEVLANTPFGNIKEVNLITIPINQALAETITSALEYLPQLEETLENTATLIQQGQEKEVGPVINRVIDGLEWYVQLLANIQTLLEPSKTDRLNSMNTQLGKLVTAWENQDFSLVADLLRYELVPELSSGRRWLGEEVLPQTTCLH